MKKIFLRTNFIIKVLEKAMENISEVQFEEVRDLCKREAVDWQKQRMVKEIL